MRADKKAQEDRKNGIEEQKKQAETDRIQKWVTIKRFDTHFVSVKCESSKGKDQL